MSEVFLQGSESASAAPPALRYGVLLHAPTVNAWQAAALEHLDRDGDAVLCLAVVAGSGAPGGSQTRQASQRKGPTDRLGAAALDLYGGRVSRARALRPSPDGPALRNVPVLRLATMSTGGPALALRADDIEAIRAHGLDFLVDLGFGSLTGDVLEAARHGVWSFRHGEDPATDGRRVGVLEILRRRSTISVVLQRQADRADGGVVLREGHFRVAPESLGLTRDRCMLGAASWPALVAREIRTGVMHGGGTASLRPAARGLDTGVGSFLRFLAIAAQARLQRLWHHGLRRDDWNIGVLDAPIASLLERRAVSGIDWAPTRAGRYAADPFGRWNGATLDVFFEDFSHARDQATIACRGWSREQGWGVPSTALDIGSHLSYPSLFEHEGRRYMLPESRAAGKLVVYEWSGADRGWQQHATLGVDGDVADATLLQQAGRWWLFAIRPNRLNPATELLLWHAERPDGPWLEHPGNPVVVDVRSARPGGPFFRVDDQLYRPAQDCSTGYGDRLAIKRVVTLTQERYEEELVTFVEPEHDGPFPYGLHTLAGAGDVTLVDGKRRVRNMAATAQAIRRRLGV
jgi:hypothetical protein